MTKKQNCVAYIVIMIICSVTELITFTNGIDSNKLWQLKIGNDKKYDSNFLC